MPQLHPKAAEDFRHHRRAVADDENRIPILKLKSVRDTLQGRGIEKLRHRRLKPLSCHPEGGEAFSSDPLRKFGEVVDHLPGEGFRLPCHLNPLDLPPRGERLRKGAEGGPSA